MQALTHGKRRRLLVYGETIEAVAAGAVFKEYFGTCYSLSGFILGQDICLLTRISHQDFGFRCICSVSECASGLKSIAIAMV